MSDSFTLSEIHSLGFTLLVLVHFFSFPAGLIFISIFLGYIIIIFLLGNGSRDLSHLSHLHSPLHTPLPNPASLPKRHKAHRSVSHLLALILLSYYGFLM